MRVSKIKSVIGNIHYFACNRSEEALQTLPGRLMYSQEFPAVWAGGPKEILPGDLFALPGMARFWDDEKLPAAKHIDNPDTYHIWSEGLRLNRFYS